VIVLLWPSVLGMWWRSYSTADVFGWFRTGRSVVAAPDSGNIRVALIAPLGYQPRMSFTCNPLGPPAPFLPWSIRTTLGDIDRRFGFAVRRGRFEPYLGAGSAPDVFVVVSYGLLAVVTGVPPLSWLASRRWRRPRWMHWAEVRGRCARCGYDLRATPDRCPECGLVPDIPMKDAAADTHAG